MRQLQFCTLNFSIAKIKQVEIDRARDVARMIGCATERFFNLPKLAEQLFGFGRRTRFP